ncbi:hypothetical protein B0H21DRAFT_818200 [Amylocystis lapponica]|nr:hypothetical protein B0H21DRAFT_818200 [Amylocystis lapponica]
MSDAPAAPVTENGVPPAAQDTVDETPSFKVFAGNLAYSTTDEGLKAFFAPVESDILSAQVILRGTRSAGYGFVAMATVEAAQKAVELLDKQELDGRPVIVEIAKPADEKDKEKKQKRFKRKPGRRGSKAVPGEVSEAEANGDASPDAEKAEGAPAGDDAAKPKKKKKNNRKPKRKSTTAEGEAIQALKKPRSRKPRTPRPIRPAGEDPAGEPSKTVLFVANLGFNIDDAGLSALFTDAGIKVTSARIEEQKKAIEALQGKDVGGRAIAVKIAVNSQTEEGSRDEEQRQRELESREEGLSKSLFERAQDEAATGQQNKALAMMMKMGFKPGQALGRKDDDEPSSSSAIPDAGGTDEPPQTTALPGPSKGLGKQLVEPLPLNEWGGKKGIGLGKRAASPSASERLAKMAKMAEHSEHESFRDRARQEYEERRAQGRLAPAQRTCATLDEKAGREFNVLWLNPDNADAFPDGLLDALDDPSLVAVLQRNRGDNSIEGRLRARMQAEALRPLAAALDDDDAHPEKPEKAKVPYSEEDIEEATQFLQLSAKDRLELVLDYLREKYAYCFWCGTQYEDDDDMDQNCPGPDEDAHD